MTARDDAFALIEDLLKLGRIREHEARALRDGLNEPATAPAATFVAVSAERLVSLRKTRGLTQQEVADACGVSRQAVTQWETGRSTPSPKHYGVLNDLLGVGSVS